MIQYSLQGTKMKVINVFSLETLVISTIKIVFISNCQRIILKYQYICKCKFNYLNSFKKYCNHNANKYERLTP